ncbi:MAG: toll/interleukin-1 receptor domain-containing protein [Pseudomonadota bacterium]
MALLDGYDNDVFISYAHHDNPADLVTGARPISQIVDFVKGQLQMRIGARGKYEVFFDHTHLGANHDIERVLRQARSSALFVAITSPSYVNDESWALREMHAFLEMADSKDRFFALELLPLDGLDSCPEILQVRKRYKFWQDGGLENKVAIPLDPVIHPVNYRVQLTSFADQLAQVLSQMYRDGARPAAPADPAPPGEPAIGTVLLAQVNDDVEFEREQVASFLRQAGARVLPEHDYPQGGEDFREAFAADLEQADLVVQLLSRSAGRMPRDLPDGYLHHQHQAAKDAGKPLLAWRHPEIDPETAANPVQRALLDSAITMAEGLHSFKDEVLLRLKEATAPPPKPIAIAPGLNTSMIYLSADRTDRALAEQLCDALIERQHPVTLPLFEGGSADEIQTEIDRNMTESDKIIVVQGAAPVSWVRSSLVRANKARALRDQPPELTALFKAPPPPKTDPNVRLPGLAELDSSDGLDIEQFCTFVEKSQGT